MFYYLRTFREKSWPSFSDIYFEIQKLARISYFLFFLTEKTKMERFTGLDKYH